MDEKTKRLINALKIDEKPSVRIHAAGQLGVQGQATAEVVTALTFALRDRVARVRFNAAFSLGKLGTASPEVVRSLVPLLADEDADVCQNATSALSTLGMSSTDGVLQVLEEELGARRDEELKQRIESIITYIRGGQR